MKQIQCRDLDRGLQCRDLDRGLHNFAPCKRGIIHTFIFNLLFTGHTEDIAMAKLIKSTEDPNGQNCSCYRRRSDETI